MNKELASISGNYPLEHFTDETNIPNQKLIREIVRYFELEEGSRVFTALEILNLLELQINFIKLNIQDSQKVISSLLSLPLSKLESHVFLGLILKWFGGYPVSNMNEDYDTTLKLIQKEFLKFDIDSPEKKFCKADEEERKKFLRLEIALNASLKHGIDATEILETLEKHEKSYGHFDEMFYDFVKNEKILQFANSQDYLFAQSIYHYEYKTWLFDKKELEYGDEPQFKNLLNVKLFAEFLGSKNKINEESEMGSVLGSPLRKEQYYEAYPDLVSQMNLFHREFKRFTFPFKNIFESNGSLQKKLFDEFNIAPLKPSFVTFLRQFYSEEEYDNAIAEDHKRVRTTKSNQIVAANFYAVSDFEKHVFRIQDEFNNLCRTDELHGKFYCPDFSHTELVKNCNYLDQRLEVLKKSVFDPTTNKYKEVEIEASNVRIILEKLSPDIRGYIKSAIISDNENILINIKSIGRGSPDMAVIDKWIDIKGKFNGMLEREAINNDKIVKPTHEKMIKDTTPQKLEDIFIDPTNAEKSLAILRILGIPVLNESNVYIGKLKGIFPLWIKLLKTNKPLPLIDHFPDIVYKNLLNAKITNLNLSKDASEFRKNYKRLENSDIESEIRFHLSQFSQTGNMGK